MQNYTTGPIPREIEEYVSKLSCPICNKPLKADDEYFKLGSDDYDANVFCPDEDIEQHYSQLISWKDPKKDIIIIDRWVEFVFNDKKYTIDVDDGGVPLATYYITELFADGSTNDASKISFSLSIENFHPVEDMLGKFSTKEQRIKSLASKIETMRLLK